MEILTVARPAPFSHNSCYFNTARVRFRRPSKTQFIQLIREGFGTPCNCNAFPNPIIGPNFGRKTALRRVAESEASLVRSLEDYEEEQQDNLLDDDRVLQSTIRLVECAMFSAIAGLAYFLSNLLRIENYFGCFFSLPLVISSMRWGVAAGRKAMVATAMLLLILSGPLKAATYLLMHGFVGLCMGALWRLELNWGLSIIICTLVRSIGALGFVLLSSWLLRENILVLITINAHASVSYMLAAVGINIVPSMWMIYVIFASLQIQLKLESPWFLVTDCLVNNHICRCRPSLVWASSELVIFYDLGSPSISSFQLWTFVFNIQSCAIIVSPFPLFLPFCFSMFSLSYLLGIC